VLHSLQDVRLFVNCSETIQRCVDDRRRLKERATPLRRQVEFWFAQYNQLTERVEELAEACHTARVVMGDGGLTVGASSEVHSETDVAARVGHSHILHLDSGDELGSDDAPYDEDVFRDDHAPFPLGSAGEHSVRKLYAVRGMARVLEDNGGSLFVCLSV
jgi:hypothetical protein